MKLILFCLLIIILEDVNTDQIVVCKQVDLSEFKQLTTTNQCSASVLFVEETSNNNNTTNKQSSLSIKQDFEKLKEQIQEIKNRSFQTEKLRNKLKELQEKFEAFKACSSNPCVNGNCSYSNNTYLCSCNPGYTGRNCEIEWFLPGNGFQYKLYNESNPTEANTNCRIQGARLASTGIRNKTMKRLIFDKLLPAGNAWVGLHRHTSGWLWSDGVVWNASNPEFGTSIRLRVFGLNYGFTCLSCKIQVGSVRTSYFSLCEKTVVK